jgi:hypothetical protein
MLRIYKYDSPYEYKDFESYLFTTLKPLFDHENDKLIIEGVEYRISTINYIGLFNQLIDNLPEYTITLSERDNTYAVFSHNADFKININPKPAGCEIHFKIHKATANDITINLPANSYGKDIVNNQITLSGDINNTFILSAIYEGGEYDWTIRGRLEGFGSAAVDWSDISNKPATFEPAPHTHYRILNSSLADVSYNVSGTSTAQYYYTQDSKVSIQFDAPDTRFVNIIQADSSLFNHLSVYENGVLVYDSDIVFESINFNAGTNSGYKLNKPVLFSSGNTYQLEFTHTGASFKAYTTAKTDWNEDGQSYPFVPNYSLYFTDYNGIDQDFTDRVLFQTLRYDKSASVVVDNGEVTVTAAQTTVYGNTVLKNDLIVEGNIIQQGAAYETHAEQLYSTKDMLLMREGAVAGLQTNELSGFRIFNYDGTNNLFFGADASGIVRVGDEGGTLQALATREDVPLNGGFAKWNASLLRFDTVDLNTVYATTVHTHDDRYYTESEIDTKLAGKSDTTHNHDTKYLGITAKAADSSKLNGVTENIAASGNSIVKRDASGQITVVSKILFSNGDALRYDDNVNIFYADVDGGTANGKFDNADKVDGLHASSFLRSDIDDYVTGHIQATDTKRSAGMYGYYDSTKLGHIWSIGVSYKIADDGSSLGNLYGLAYMYPNAGIGTYANGHQMLWVQNGIVYAAIGNDIWTRGAIRLNEGTSRRASLYYDTAGNFVMLHNNTADGGLKIYDSDGHVVFGSTVTASDFIPTSDRRLKSDIDYNINKGIEGLKPVSFKINEHFRYGFIAQDVLKTHPELVTGTGKKNADGDIDYYSIKESSIIALLVKEVQDLKNQVKNLKNGIK